MSAEYFEARERALLGERYDTLYAAPQETAARGVTVSALRTTPEEFAARADFPLRPSPFCKAAFVVEQPDFKPGRHPYHHAGVFYSQEPSASSAAPLLGVKPGMRVLDLCAAPGGKSSQLAAALQGQGLLVSNEYVAARADILKSNLERMGVSNAVVLNESPARIADENAPQRTVYWEADLAENRRFGVQYRYRETAAYTDPLDFTPDAEQPTFDTGEEAPHIVFTPYLKALAHQLTDGITDPAEKAKRIYDYVTLNVRYHYQPAYFVQECLPDHCARDRRGDCGIMALTFITLCRIVGIPAQWQSGLSVSLTGVGCHDWAMFYIAPKGWMYADCSFGASMARLGDETMRRHYFGSLDTGRMVANRAFEAPFDPPMTGFRSDPYDNQSGECEVDGVGLYGDALDTRKELVDYELLEA